MRDFCFGDGSSHHRLFEKSAEDKATAARGTPIKPEGELLQVGLQMGIGHGTLVGTENPALQQTRNSVHTWHGNVCRVPRGGQYGLLMRVPALR